MNADDLIAIDIHTHAEVSCWNPFDHYGEAYDRAADKYFGSDRSPTMAETIACYRERKIGLVMFTVDSEAQIGRRRIPNKEIAEAAKANSAMMIAFASIDPHKGKMAAREARRLMEAHGVKGFKFHPEPGAAQARCVDRPERLEPQLLSSPVGSIRQHPAEGPHAVWRRLCADHARALDEGL